MPTSRCQRLCLGITNGFSGLVRPQTSAIATASLDEPEGYRDGGNDGPDEQDVCHPSNLSGGREHVGKDAEVLLPTPWQ